jgi:PST family polysaccharide transporter
MALLAGSTLVVRAASLLAQLALAKLLLKDDFGLYGLTLTVWGFVQLLTSPGLDDVLIARKARLHIWVSPAAWMSLTLGVAGMLVMAGAAPVAAWAYDDPRLSPLVLVMALAAIPSALQIVPGAVLRARLRFRAWAAYLLLSQIAIYGLQVGLAVGGLGAMAFVLPIPIVAALSAAALWWMARPGVGVRPRVRRWRYLMGDSVILLITRAVQTVQGQADRIALGIIATTTVAGVYYFAFQFATQVTRVLASNLHQVLFPGLASLKDDPARQLAGAINAARLVGFVGLPLACLQAAMVEPFLRLLFGDKWAAAVLPAQIMSVAMGVDCVAWVAVSLLQAQRRFARLMWLFVASCVAFVLLIAAAALLAPDGREAVAVAAATGVHALIVPAVFFACAVRVCGGRARDVIPVYATPVLLAPPAALAGVWASGWIDASGPRADLLRLLVIGAVGASVYAGLTLALARDQWHDLITRLRGALRRRRASPGSGEP